jgi:hypothetical protein
MPASAEAPPATSAPPAEPLGELDLVRITSTGEGFTGPYIEVQVFNPTDHDVEARIPCGTIFAPGSGSDEQRLMVVQEAAQTVGPGEEATLTPYIVCIDADQAAPGEESSFSYGEMAEGDLLVLAQCVCQENLAASINPMDELSLQFSAWMVAEGRPLGEIPAGEGGAIDEALGEGAADQLAELLSMLEGLSGTWLDRCGIDLEG